MSWEKVKLGDVCTKIGSGATPKGGSTVYIENGTTFIRSQNVYNLRFDYSGLVHINDSAAQKLKGVTIEEGDILLNITGDSVARTCIVPNELLPARVNQHVAIVRPDSRILNPYFLNYYLASPFMQAYMLGLAVGKGASRNAMTKDMIENFEVPCPKIEVQEKTVDILKPYDDLIENNQKQIQLLEEAAQRLYKEWFVDLHFPGHENVKIVDGVPEGWKTMPLGEAISFEIGGGWGEESATEKNECEAYVIRGTDFDGLKNGCFLNIPLRFHTENNLSSRKLQHGDIIFKVSGGSRTEGVARTVRITNSMLERWDKPVMCASFCKLVRPLNDELAQFLFNYLRYLRAAKITEEYDKRSASSIVNYRWKDFLNQRTLLYPKAKLLNQYNKIAVPLYEKIVALSLQIETAKLARDRLLPKLMSGEIEV